MSDIICKWSLIFSILLAHPCIAGPVNWLAPVDGLWSDPNAWDGLSVPSLADDVPTLGHMGPYTVRSLNSAAYEYLRIENPQAVLDIVGSASHVTLSGVMNNGQINIGDPLIPGSSKLQFTHESELVGSGILEIHAQLDPEDTQMWNFIGGLSHGPDHTIIGSGQLIVLQMMNYGQIVSTNNVGLRLIGSYTQSFDGTLAANNGILRLGQDLEVEGGHLNTEGTGVVLLEGSGISFKDVRINGLIQAAGGDHTLTLSGDIANYGTLSLRSETAGQRVEILLENNTSITGSGALELRAVGEQEDAMLRVMSDSTAMIGSEQTVRIEGRVEVDSDALLQVEGTIASIPDAQPMVIRGPLAGNGELFADGADIVLLNSLTQINGLRLRSDDAAIKVQLGAATLLNCTNDGLLILEGDRSSVFLEGAFTNNAHVLAVEAGEVQSFKDTLIDGAGVIELVSTKDLDARVDIISNTTVIGPLQTIMGSGEVKASLNSATLVNQGLIVATDPDQPLKLRGNHVSDGGEYRAESGDLLLLYGLFIEDPYFTTSQGHEVLVDSALLNKFVNTGTMRVIGEFSSSPDGIAVGNSLNNGQIILDPYTTFALEGGSSIAGSGTIQMKFRSAINTQLVFSNPPVIGQDQTIRGEGEIDGYMHIDGVIIGDQPEGELFITGGFTFGPEAEIIADAAPIHLSGSFSGAHLKSIHHGEFTGSGLSFTDTYSDATLKIAGGSLSLLSDMTNDGYIQLSPNSIILLDHQSGIFGDGILELSLTPDDSVGNIQIYALTGKHGKIGPDQTLRGAGRLMGRIIIEGTLQPTLPQNSFHLMDTVLAEQAVLKVTLSGTQDREYGNLRLLPAGSLELWGDLFVELEPGYAPSIGDSWSLVSSLSSLVPGSVTGSFQSVQMPAADQGLHYLLVQEDEEVRLVLTCASDFTGDFHVNFFDVSAFLQAFSQEDPVADINGDGAFNFFDVGLFISGFAQGCSL